MEQLPIPGSAAGAAYGTGIVWVLVQMLKTARISWLKGQRTRYVAYAIALLVAVVKGYWHGGTIGPFDLHIFEGAAVESGIAVLAAFGIHNARKGGKRTPAADTDDDSIDNVTPVTGQ